MPMLSPLHSGRFFVEYTVRGWSFKTQAMSKDAANQCLKDFQFANPSIQFAATIKPAVEGE